jgi:hypothetical protein
VTTYAGSDLDLVPFLFRYDSPNRMALKDLRSLLESTQDLIAVSTPFWAKRDSPEEEPSLSVVQAIRQHADASTYVIRISYSSPLEIILALSAGATAITLLASRFASAISKLAQARVDIAKAHTEVMLERNKQEAIRIVREELRRSDRNSLLDIHIDPVKPAVADLVNSAADALTQIEDIRRLDESTV